MAAMKTLLRIFVATVFLIAVAKSSHLDCVTTGSRCIRYCFDLPDGNYQSCRGCHTYMSCVAYKPYDDRPCAGKLYWDDNTQTCVSQSSTCTCVLPPRVNGQWSAWGPWSSCSATCGTDGTRHRERYCNDPEPDNEGAECSGPNREIESCSEWTCPDCDRTCTEGELDVDCSQCLCTGDSVLGEVTIKDTPLSLSNVGIFTVGREWNATIVSDGSGTFAISGVCADGLKLTATKKGYESAYQEYIVTPGDIVSVIMIKLEKPVFTVEPLSTAGLLGGTASFTCQATADPEVEQIDWLKDGVIVRTDEISGNSGAVYEITDLTVEDQGTYACRAASKGGKIISRNAYLYVNADPSASDTCTELPLEKNLALKTCNVTTPEGTTSYGNFNVGKCSKNPCISVTSPDPANQCCVPTSTRPLTVNCGTYTYTINQVVKCGCGEGTNENLVTVIGQVKYAGAGVSMVSIVNDGYSYQVANGHFLLEAMPRAGRIVLNVQSTNYMPHLETLVIEEGVTAMYVEIDLSLRPEPQIINAAEESQVYVVVPGQTSPVAVNIPANSFQDENGNPITGEVSVFMLFADPRTAGALDSTPGQFTYEDSEGKEQHLKTYGVVTVDARDENQNDVFFSGPVTMSFDAVALGIDTGADVSLFSMDHNSGQWLMAGALTETGSRRRRRRRQTTSTLQGEIEIPANVPYLSIDEPILQSQLCSVAVYVYNDDDFTAPLAGEKVSAFTIENEEIVGQTSAFTGTDGKACVIVLCGQEHIVKIKSSDGVIVHPTHSLPIDFIVSNTEDRFQFTATPPATEASALDGPVFAYQSSSDGCATVDSSAYHFKLAVLGARPSLDSALSAVEMRAGFENSWFPNNSSNRKACAVQVEIEVTNPNEMRVIGTSAYSGGPYGTYTSTMMQRDSSSNNYRVACVLVRCPTTHDTEIKLQIAYPDSEQCRFLATSLGASDIPTAYVSNTDTSIQLLSAAAISEGDVEGSADEGAMAEDVLFRAEGAGDLAFYRVIEQCTSSIKSTATFSCTPE